MGPGRSIAISVHQATELTLLMVVDARMSNTTSETDADQMFCKALLPQHGRISSAVECECQSTNRSRE